MFIASSTQTNVREKVSEMKQAGIQADAIITEIGIRDQVVLFCELIGSKVEESNSREELLVIGEIINKFSRSVEEKLIGYFKAGKAGYLSSGSDLESLKSNVVTKSIRLLAEQRRGERAISEETRRQSINV